MKRKKFKTEILNKMTLGVMLLTSVMWLSCSNSDDDNNGQPAQTIDATFEHGGLTRDYQLYKPANLPANAPLLFVLHSYSGSASLIRNYSAMNALANENGFAVCYPQGLID